MRGENIMIDERTDRNTSQRRKGTPHRGMIHTHYAGEKERRDQERPGCAIRVSHPRYNKYVCHQEEEEE
jgi:hypothetical protein